MGWRPARPVAAVQDHGLGPLPSRLSSCFRNAKALWSTEAALSALGFLCPSCPWRVGSLSGTELFPGPQHTFTRCPGWMGMAGTPQDEGPRWLQVLQLCSSSSVGLFPEAPHRCCSLSLTHWRSPCATHYFLRLWEARRLRSLPSICPEYSRAALALLEL